MLNSIRDAIVSLEQRMNRRFESVDMRFSGLEARLTAMDQKIDLRTDALDAKLSRHFMWLVGMQITTLVAVLAAVLAR